MEQGLQTSSHGLRSVLQIWLDYSVEGKKQKKVSQKHSNPSLKRAVNHNIYGLMKGKNITTNT